LAAAGLFEALSFAAVARPIACALPAEVERDCPDLPETRGGRRLLPEAVVSTNLYATPSTQLQQHE
jgi:hypothetical protein